MKLFGAVAVYVEAEEILRQPRFFEKLRRAFGGKPDLRTGRVRASLEATAIVEATRDTLRRIGITNAISLVIDDTVLFQDTEGKHDDLGDLFFAFHDNDSVFGQGFRELRLAVEYHEAGLHLVLEIQARSEHPRTAASVRVLTSGRIEALTPRPGEDAASYRRRAEPIATDAKALEVLRAQFTAFVDRVRDALAAALPNAEVEVEVAESRIVRPSEAPQAPQKAPPPDSRGYDPYDHYYPVYGSALGAAADALFWASVFSTATPPHYVVVDHGNHFQGHADDPGIQSGPTAEAEPSVLDSWWDDATASGADADDTRRTSWWDELTGSSDSGSSDSGSSDSGSSDGGGWSSDSGDSGGGFDGGGFDGGVD